MNQLQLLHLPRYPRMVRVTGHPVHVAPELAANYFFAEGHFWLLLPEGWYASAWFNGPWDAVRPERVPTAVLHIPVSAYRNPPAWFDPAWPVYSPPRWDDCWGEGFSRVRAGWQRREPGLRATPMPPPRGEHPRQAADQG